MRKKKTQRMQEKRLKLKRKGKEGKKGDDNKIRMDSKNGIV